MSKAGPTTATSNGTPSSTASASANTSTPSAPQSQGASASTVRSAWSKGPPAIPAPTPAAGAASANDSAAGTRASSVSGSPQLGSTANGTVQGSNGPANGTGNGQPAAKKASLLAIGADGKAAGQQAGTAKPMNIARAGQPGSAINFGSIDSPSAQLSSSPAAPTSTGSHLPSGLKSFGSIEAEKGGPAPVTSPVIGHSRKLSNMSGLVIPPFQGGNKSPAAEASQPGKSTPSPQPAAAAAAAPPKKFNPHALFQSNVSPAPSMASTSATSPPPVGGLPPNATGQGMYMQQGRPQMQQALGYDNQGRPLTMGGPGGQPFSPQQVPGMPNHNGQPFPGMNPYPQHQQPGGVPQFRPAPGQAGMPNGLAGSRSPNMAHQQPHTFNPQQPQFRPQQQPGQNGPQQGQRSGGPNSLSPRAQHQQLHPVPGGMGAYGMYPGQMQGYPGGPYQGGYYAYANMHPDPQNPYAGMPQQWQVQQGRPGYPGGMPNSPRNAPASLSGSSPAPSHAGLPGQPGTSGNASPALSSSRPTMGGSQAPHSLSHQNSGISTTSSQSSVPGTPNQANARPFQPGSAFGHLSPAPGGPGSPMNPSLSAGATAFTPRAKVPLTFKRPDGTPFDVAAAAQSAKASSSAATASAASSEAGATTAPATPAGSEATKPKTAGLPYKPVVVRLETEAQKEARLAEEAKEKRIKEIEQKEEAERKERKAREEAEKVEKAEKEKKEAEAKAEEERIAKEQAEKDAAAKEAKDKEEAEAKRKAEAEEQARKQAEDEAAAKSKADAAAKEASDAEAKKTADADAAAAEEKKTAAAPAVAEKAETASAAVSADPSPAASPASGSAALPNRPTSAAKRPQPLDLANSPAPSSPAIASAAAITSAKPIEDINSITYPSPLQSPVASLNTDAEPGKFRYDRTFLLQFMEVCKEKPEALPPFAAIGMEADTSGGFGRGGSRTGQSRGSGGGMPRGGAGLGISNMGSFGGKGAMGTGMGSFGMGNFSSTKGTTSEERAAASARAGAAGVPGRMSSGGMMRAPSQTGPMGMSSFGRPSSRPGKKRPERAPAPSFATPEPGVAPLELSANRWAPGVQSRRPGAVDESSPEFVERKVKALLNKLTKEKFESISNQILEWANKSTKETDGQTLRLVIKLIFEKAKDEQFWSEMYARLCVKIHQQLSNEIQDTEMRSADGAPIVGGPLFRKYLLGRCQEDFEKGWKKRDDASAAAKAKADDDAQKKAEHDKAVAGGQQVEEFKFSDEYYAEQTAKRQGLGLVKFVGELFKLGLLSPKIIVACVKQLLRNVIDPDEEDVESLCQLLSTAGSGLDAHSPQSKQTVDIFMTRMDELSKSPHITSRIKFMVVDVIELRRNRWVSRNAAANAGPMTIEEVHRAAAQEQAQAARAAAMAPTRGYDNMSRGGSRRGDQRVPHPAQHGGQEGWQPAGRPPAKAADMSNFGKIKSGGPTSFGPSSVFAGKKSGKAGGDATPPLSRTSSSANMFSVLGSGNADAGPSETPAADGTSDSGPQRKKLVLKPRSEPKEGEEAEEEGDEDEEEEEATPAAAATGGDFEGSAMTKGEVERKITADLKELWGEKDAAGTRRPEDIVEYFQYLPEGARHMLATKLVDDVFRIAKMADTEIVVKGFELAIEQDLITPEIVKQSVSPSVELLDDLAVDIPQAYTFAAKLIVAGNLEDADVTELAEKIEDFGGEVALKPKDKLIKAVAKLNGEDAPAAA